MRCGRNSERRRLGLIAPLSCDALTMSSPAQRQMPRCLNPRRSGKTSAQPPGPSKRQMKKLIEGALLVIAKGFAIDKASPAIKRQRGLKRGSASGFKA